MKAIVLEQFGGVEHFKLKDVADPHPKANEVRIRLKAAAFNPVDYKRRKGGYGGPLPVILGSDCSGVIDQIGAHVHNFAVGDEVVAMPFGQGSNGSYAEFVCLPAPFVAKKPKNLSFDQAASFPLVGLTAYRALFAPHFVQKGDSLFIAGAGGGVGSLIVSMAKHMGVSVFTIASNSKSLEYLTHTLKLPKEHIVLYEGLSDEELIQQLMKRNKGRLFDVTCDCVGHERKSLCLQLTRSSGFFSTIVPEREGFELPIWSAGSIPIAKNLSMHFTFVGAESFSDDPESWNIYAKQLSLITEWIEQGVVTVPAVTRVGNLSLETVKKAHHLLEEGKVKGKLVMEIGQQ